MIRRFGSWIASHPVLTLGLLGAITAFFLVFAPRIEFLADMEKMLPADDPVVQRLRETQRLFGSQSAILIGVAPREGNTLFTVEHVAQVYRLTRELEALVDQGFLEEVISPTNVQIVKSGGLALVVRKPLKAPPETEAEVEEFRELLLSQRGLVGSMVKPDGKAFLIILNIHPEIEDNKEKIAELMERLEGILAPYKSSLSFYLTGDVAFIHFMDLYMRRDLVFLFPVVVLVVLGVLYLSFRSLRGVVLPLVVVIVAVIWVMGLMSLSGVKLSMISSFLPVLLVAVGSAYGIHVVNDYFKKAPLHNDRKALVVEVVGDMANPVFASALTTAAGFLTLISAFLIPIKQFGIFAAVGVIFSFVISITLIPTVLSLLPFPKKARGEAGALGRLPRFLAGIVYRHRVPILVAVSLAFVAFLALIPRLEVESDITTYFRSDAPIIKGLEFVEKHFGGSQQMSVVVDTGRRDGVKDPEVLSFISELEAFLEDSGIVGNTVSIADLIEETNYALHGEDEAYYSIPESPKAVAQLLLLFRMGGGEILKGMVTDDFSKAQIIVRVRSVGTKEYKKLLEATDRFIAENAPPGVTGYLTGSLGIYVHISEKIGLISDREPLRESRGGLVDRIGAPGDRGGWGVRAPPPGGLGGGELRGDGPGGGEARHSHRYDREPRDRHRRRLRRPLHHEVPTREGARPFRQGGARGDVRHRRTRDNLQRRHVGHGILGAPPL